MAATINLRLKGRISMSGIFICYRRSDAEGWAGRLADSLKGELGKVNIFRDIEDIPPGVEFASYINEAVGRCSVLIALIGPNWLTVKDKNGVRRIDDSKDFTRLEIVTALKRNVRVIPALVSGANTPDIDELPDELMPLARRQSYELSDTRWADDCRKLADVLRPIVKQESWLSTKVAKVILVSLLVLITFGFGGMLWYDHNTEKIQQESALERQKQEEEAAKQAELDKQMKVLEAKQAEIERMRKREEARLAEVERKRKEDEAVRQKKNESIRAEKAKQKYVLPQDTLRLTSISPQLGSILQGSKPTKFKILLRYNLRSVKDAVLMVGSRIHPHSAGECSGKYKHTRKERRIPIAGGTREVSIDLAHKAFPEGGYLNFYAYFWDAAEFMKGNKKLIKKFGEFNDYCYEILPEK